MYRTCIFCSADLGANDSVEEFPVGRSIAFDAWKGRLWAVCPKCARWNLAPIEERWEAIEAAEKLFRDARLRAQSENVGLAKLRDGTRLIRIGAALPGELAAWRYGDQMVRRRRRFLAAGGVTAAFVVGGVAVGLFGVAIQLAIQFGGSRMLASTIGDDNLVHVFPPGSLLPDTDVGVRRSHLDDAFLALPESGAGLVLHVPDAGTHSARRADGRQVWVKRSLVLDGEDALVMLRRAMLYANSSGAGRSRVEGAVDLLARSGSADAFLHDAARRRLPLFPRHMERRERTTRTLALEMALHEETERRALEGELAVLETAWRVAEEIAAIADALPDDPLERIKAG